MPFVFRCGALLVIVLDSRGERDVFRAELPILGAAQWQFIDQVFERVPTDVDAIAVVTATPVASQDPDGQTQRLLGDRTDDVEAFARGDEQELFHPRSNTDTVELVRRSRASRSRAWRALNRTWATSRSRRSTKRATSGRTTSRGASSRIC